MELLLFNELAIFEFGFVYYGFSFYERCVFVFQGIVKFPHLSIWLRTTTYHDHFLVVVLSKSRHCFLGAHGPYDFANYIVKLPYVFFLFGIQFFRDSIQAVFGNLSDGIPGRNSPLNVNNRSRFPWRDWCAWIYLEIHARKLIAN